MAVLYIQWWLEQISLWRQPEIGTWTVDVLWCLEVMSLRSPPPSHLGDLPWNKNFIAQCGAQSPHRHEGRRPFFLSAVSPVWMILRTDHDVSALWGLFDQRTLVESWHIKTFFGQKIALTWHVWITDYSIPHSDRAIYSHGRGDHIPTRKESETMLCHFLKYFSYL